MIKLGVIGHPLKHTLSPVMHNAALKTLNLEGIYLPFEVSPERLKDATSGFIALGFKGYNVTIPFKISIMEYLDEITDEAKAVGAVNTVIITPDNKTIGDNTDVFGFMSAFSENDLQNLAGKRSVIIGAGGAARAVGAALLKMKLASITLYDKFPENATATANKLKEVTSYQVSINVDSSDNINLKNIDLLINASPVGMYPHVELCPVSDNLLDDMNPSAIVYDLVYRPFETQLQKKAKERGYKTCAGAEMLVMQGAKAFEKWTLKPAPADVMRERLLESLENEH